MKWLTAPLLLAAALFSAVVVIPFLPSAKEKSLVFTLDITAASTVAGSMQLYYDDGTGYRESESSRDALAPDGRQTVLHLALPPGTYRSLRLDPIDREGTVTISDLRIVTSGGRVVRVFPPSVLRAANQIATIKPAGSGVEIATTARANDPQLALELNGPLALWPTWVDLLSGFWPRAGGVFVGLMLGLALMHLGPWRGAGAKLTRWARERPGRAIVVVAALAVVASAYPVVFLGASYVSPNFGVTLLYDEYPTLPGYTDTLTVDPMGSDVGAIMWQHVPFSMLQHDALAHGELPLWNRYSAGGTPLLAQGQSMFGDPLHLLVIAANGAAWAWDLKYLIAKWLFAIALGLLVIAVVNGPPRGSTLVAALLVTVAAPFLGFFVYRINHPAFFSVCYAPWVLYCWVRAVQAERLRSFACWATALVGANIALMNSGTAKEAYMLLLSLNFSGACVLLFAAQPWRTRLVKFAGLTWAGVLFALITAPVWLTFLATLRHSYTSYNAVSAFQIQPALLLGAFDEAFYRPLMIYQRTFNPSVNFLILLGLLYFLATLRLSFRQPAALALAASSVVPLAFAFGIVPARWVVEWPFLSNVAHLDNSFTCVLLVLWSVLAGVGFARAAERLRTAEGRDDLVIAGVLLGGLVGAWIGFGQAVHRAVFGPGTTFSPLANGQPLPISNFLWGYLAALLAAAVVAAWVARRALARRTLSPAAAIILAVCAIVMLWRQGFQAQAAGFETYVVRPPVRVDFRARSPGVELVRAAVRNEPARAVGLRNNFFPGWTVVYGLETINGPDALANPYWRELTSNLPGVQRIWDWRLYLDPPEIAKARRYLDALNVGYYLDLRSDQAQMGQALHLVKAADLDVYASSTTWPRAFFTDRVAVYDQVPEFVQMITQGDGQPLAAVQRTDAAAQSAVANLPHDLSGHAVVRAANYRLTENTTGFDLRASGPGVIVLNEAYWPDAFRAEINGRPAAIFRVNHALAGVAVPAAGDYHVVFRCVPPGFPRNVWLCGLGTGLLAVSLALAFRRRRALAPPAAEPTLAAS
jgi:hypothetical protein